MKKTISIVLILVTILTFASVSIGASAGYEGSMKNYFSTKQLNWTSSMLSFGNDNQYCRLLNATNGAPTSMLVEFIIGSDSMETEIISHGNGALFYNVSHSAGKYYNKLYNTGNPNVYTFTKGTIDCF
ncbi:hypothetical protein LJC07_08135 [Christensenellaceae bacterium OttesenSCG-928-L17]|nr:hypothetical protein [Christensenellaceae bacterium OttesenSCG-928-L17]